MRPTVAGSPSSQGDRLVPDQFVCPITLAVMLDPVSEACKKGSGHIDSTLGTVVVRNCREQHLRRLRNPIVEEGAGGGATWVGIAYSDLGR